MGGGEGERTAGEERAATARAEERASGRRGWPDERAARARARAA